MTATRRATSNFALTHAAETARRLGKPLVVFEPLRIDYPWASDRLHRFVIEGMRDNQSAFEAAGVVYLPYVEPQANAARGLLAALATRACVVVTDDHPCGFHPRMQRAAAELLDVQLVAVDSCGLLPLRALPRVDGAPRRFGRAVDFRRHLQRTLPAHLMAPTELADIGSVPADSPAEARVGAAHAAVSAVTARWPRARIEELLVPGGLEHLAIDHSVAPVLSRPGGPRAARDRLDAFVPQLLRGYGERNAPDADVTSGLSPHLHFGHIGPHEILATIAPEENWSPDLLQTGGNGSRAGWWRMSAPAESFLDQLVTWRELCFHTCHVLPETYDRYESIPPWAQRTLSEHEADRRDALYSLEQFDAAATHDPLWNAAQNQLREDGVIHNYLRMLWGKKILEWSPSARAALDVMIALNDRYALDGRDPNSYGGILWVLGRHDRAWGPERPVFGKVRFMSSDNTARKLRVARYVERWKRSGAPPAGGLGAQARFWERDC